MSSLCKHWEIWLPWVLLVQISKFQVQVIWMSLDLGRQKIDLFEQVIFSRLSILTRINLRPRHLCLFNSTCEFGAYDEANTLFVISYSGCLLLYSHLLYHSFFDFIVPPFVPIIRPSTLQSDIISLFPSPLLLFYTLRPPLYYYPLPSLFLLYQSIRPWFPKRRSSNFPTHPPS